MRQIDTTFLEREILGRLLFDGELITTAKSILLRNDFTVQEHLIIYDAMLSLHSRNKRIDPVMVINEINRNNLDHVISPYHIYELAVSGSDYELFDEYAHELVNTRYLETGKKHKNNNVTSLKH